MPKIIKSENKRTGPSAHQGRQHEQSIHQKPPKRLSILGKTLAMTMSYNAKKQEFFKTATGWQSFTAWIGLFFLGLGIFVKGRNNFCFIGIVKFVPMIHGSLRS